LVGAGAGGGSVVVMSVEVLESLRELIRIGALSAATVSMGLTLMTGKPVAVGRQPASGPRANGQDTTAPDPRIDGAPGLDHSFGEHAPQWFGRPVPKRTHFEAWKALLRRALQNRP